MEKVCLELMANRPCNETEAKAVKRKIKIFAQMGLKKLLRKEPLHSRHIPAGHLPSAVSSAASSPLPKGLGRRGKAIRLGERLTS